MQFNFKRNNIVLIICDDYRKYVRLADNIEHSGYLYKIPFLKMWDIMFQPVRRPDGMVAMDKGIIPVYDALGMGSEPGIMVIPDSKSVIISKLDESGEEYRDLLGESMGISLV